MKKNLVLLALGALTFVSCQTQPKEDYSWIKKGLDAASAQLQLTAEEISSTNMLPRSIRTGYDMNFLCRQLERDSLTFKDSLRAQPTADQLGKRRLCSVYDWTSGFYPGSLWYAYELTGNDTLKTWAIQYTNLLNPVRYYTGTHDLGFMVNCSYGNAERLAPNDTIAAVMKETADNLSQFEKDLHEWIEQRRPISSKTITDRCLELNRAYFGDAVIVDDLQRYGFYYVPHFYYNFYVYKYTLGMAVAISFVKEIRKGNVAPYREFLTKGGSESPLDELRHAGVDPASDKVYDDAFTYFQEIMAQFISLRKENA